MLVEYSLNPAIYSLPTCKMALSTDQVAQLSSDVAAAVTQALSSHTEMSSEVGRPKADVNLDAVEFLQSLNLSVTKIGTILGVSRSTIYRRMTEEGRVMGTYSMISDASIDSIVRRIKEDHPNDGEVMMAGHLHRIGVRVTRAKLRASIHRIDPQGVVARGRRIIARRVYSAPHANYIWHLHSHHKLIRWRMVIHGAIDGFSRKILYLCCANNNKATTVVSYFSHAASMFGLPDKIRSDKGGENVDVWRYVLRYHDMDPTYIIVGSSTHNERIERLWGDVFRCVGQIFYSMLYSLEEEGFLDPLNDIDLFCVHFAVLPELNRCLREFVDSWNHHCLSSEHNMTPEQLYTLGLIEKQSSEADDGVCSGRADFQSIDLAPYGMEETTVVDVPYTPDAVCSTLCNQLTVMQTRCTCSEFGKSVYLQAIRAVGTHIQSGCEECFF